MIKQKLKAPQIADLDDDVVKESGQKLDNNPDAYENESQNVEESGNISIRNCAICFEMFVPNDAICTSNNPDCNHVYHHECIFNWLLKNEDCPCCRRDYLAFEPISGCI